MNPPSAPVAAPASLARVIPRDQHTISRTSISPNALRVLYRLKDAGYQAFLVGGCVRDLLIGIEPKDFDVATNALPDEVRRLFRNSRLVGRRFRLAHVFFGREIIEVATFRAATAPSQAEEPVADLDDDELPAGAEAGLPPAAAVLDADPDADQDDDSERLLHETGRILRDNVYGSIDADVWRRDFTANALYYNIADFSLWDYVDGFEDVAARRLRLIGDPETRYREDPVRMLRAARFEAKLGFQLDPATEAPIRELRRLLADVPPARLFDEAMKLFLTGHGAASLGTLRRHGLLEILLPNVDRYLERHPGSVVEKLLVRGLENTDGRVRQDKPVTPTFLFALLFYGPIAAAIESLPPSQWHEPSAIVDGCDIAVREAQSRVTIPKRFALGVREMFAMQPRLEHRRGRRSLRLLEHPRFRAGYDLLLLRAEFGLAPAEVAEWWTRLQEVDVGERERMADALMPPATQGGGGGRRRRGGRGRQRRPRQPSQA